MVAMWNKARFRHPPAAIEQVCVPWLLACALATIAPHAEHLPYWLSLLAAGALLLRFWIWHRNLRLPGRWQITLIVVTAMAAIHMEYKTLLGRDAGVALLVLFMALKPLEMHRRRDAVVVVMLGFFLLLTHYFHAQGIAVGLWLLLSVLLQTATLLRLHGGAQPLPAILRRAGLLLLQAAPLTLLLFLLFPRINGPLWGLPQDAYGSRSGLPDTIEAGSIAHLVLDGNIAFRVLFNGSPPPNDRLYWRGPVMETFDGRVWHPKRLAGETSPRIEANGDEIAYEITLEPHQQRWLLSLDAPVLTPPGSTVNARMQTVSREPVRLRSRHAFRSALDYRFNAEESASALAAALALPAAGNPRARELAANWRKRHGHPQKIVNEALDMFREQDFFYTLNPPLLGEHPVDEFLFETKKGFCEHYASAFVFLMRAAGIPARIVAGYQGGERNPVDGYLVIRQSDAHAWAEIWQEGFGWQRVDPTAATAPERVEHGIASALPAGENLPVLARIDLDWLRTLRFRWEAINNVWNQWVLGYNPERQRELLSRFGMKDADWRGMTLLMATLCGSVLLLLAGVHLWRRPRLDPAQRAWLVFCARLQRLGLPREPWEGPLDYAARIADRRPDLASIVQTAALAYSRARYGRQPEALGCLREQTGKLPRRWSIV